MYFSLDDYLTVYNNYKFSHNGKNRNSQDFSLKKLSVGNGSYIYIETSLPRKYNEKARLNSPWMRGAQRMTFFYSMYGSTVESLSVYVRINGTEARVWSRYRSHVSKDWIEACLTINYAGMYLV